MRNFTILGTVLLSLLLQGSLASSSDGVKRSPLFHGTFTHGGKTLKYQLNRIESTSASADIRVKRSFFNTDNKDRDTTDEIDDFDSLDDIIDNSREVSREDDNTLHVIGITASVVMAVKVLAAIISGVVFATSQ